MTQNRPLVTLSYAQTLDGRLATASGSSQWISGPESLQFSHTLRAKHDAIMVGVGTVLCDNPRLTVRLVAGPDPLRIVVDSKLRTPLDAAVLAAGAAPGTVFAITAHAPAERVAAIAALGANILLLPADMAGRVDLAALLAALHQRGINSLMVEGGATLITALLRAQLADHIAICVAPKILGAGIEAIGDLGIRKLGQAITLADIAVQPYGADLIIEGRLVYAEQQG